MSQHLSTKYCALDQMDHPVRVTSRAINYRFRWDITRSTFAGIDVLAVGARVLAQMRDEQVLRVLSQVVNDLVVGELLFIY